MANPFEILAIGGDSKREDTNSFVSSSIPHSESPRTVYPIRKENFTNHILSDGAIWGSVDRRRSEIHLLSEVLSHLFEPSLRVMAVDDAPQKAQAFPYVESKAPSCGGCRRSRMNSAPAANSEWLNFWRKPREIRWGIETAISIHQPPSKPRR
jgi:hypothetical protein